MSNLLKAGCVLLSVFIAIACCSICAAFSNSDQSNFDVYYYEINISINPSNETIDGSVSAKAISMIDNLTQVKLDLYQNLSVTAVTGNCAGYIHNNDSLLINLDRGYNKNESFGVTIFYNGKPSLSPGFNPMTFDRSRSVATISSESCPYYARYWWPCKDRSDDKPDSMDLKITVPSNLTVAANGALIEIKDNGDGTKTFHWQIRNPIATYLVSFTISNYQIIEDNYVNAEDTLSIMHFVYPEHYDKALIDFNNLNNMIQILESYYGKYPYYNEKYGVAEYVGYWGGMEYQTLVCVQPYYITGNHLNDDLFVHELAHQWWGDCVTPRDFHHSWISEGFATFSEALYFGHLDGQQRYHSYMMNENDALDSKGIMYRHDISEPNQVYAGIVYYKGAWVLHMLRHVVGESNFWAGLREYRDRFEYDSATTEDLQYAFEQIIGDSLGWFFHQWVYEPNYPQYAYAWHQEFRDGQHKLYAFIRQDQTDAPLFKMPIDLTITTAASETTFTIMVADSLERFKFVSPDSIISFQLDKENWVLKKTEVIASPILKYVNHQITDSTGNHNGLADPGESVEILIRITNTGIISRSITARLISSDASLEIPADTFRWDEFDAEYEELSNDLEIPFVFSVKPGTAGHLATLKLLLEADYNYSKVDSFDVKIGNPTMLLVDDDNGMTYEQYFHHPMSLAKIYADNWEVKSQGVPSFTDVLQKYQTVLWFTGDDRTTSLTREEQKVMGEYLDHRGWLILTGQNIGYDLVADGSPDDSSFFANYLHAELLSDSVKSTMMRGETGDPIGIGSFVYIQEKSGSAGNQNSPSAIIPRDGASSFLKYIPQNTTAGIHYMDDQKGYRLVYLAFGFEGISGPFQDTAQKLLSRIQNWLSGTTEIAPFDLKNLPVQFQLEQNHPNPFNPTTTIRYYLPQADQVELNIFNLKGQKIITLVDKLQSPGIYELLWDGRDSTGLPVASGIYVYQLKTKTFVESKKLALIK